MSNIQCSKCGHKFTVVIGWKDRCPNCKKKTHWITKEEKMIRKGNRVKIIGGNFEGKNWIGSVGIVESTERKGYLVEGKETHIVYVELSGELHCFNDYHLQVI